MRGCRCKAELPFNCRKFRRLLMPLRWPRARVDLSRDDVEQLDCVLTELLMTAEGGTAY